MTAALAIVALGLSVLGAVWLLTRPSPEAPRALPPTAVLADWQTTTIDGTPILPSVVDPADLDAEPDVSWVDDPRWDEAVARVAEQLSGQWQREAHAAWCEHADTHTYDDGSVLCLGCGLYTVDGADYR